MSRTYRRKGNTPYWVTQDCVYVARDLGDVWDWREWKHVQLEGKERKKEINSYHSDNHRWICCRANREDRRLYGHKYDRQRTRRKLKEELHALEKGHVVFDKTRDISWILW